MRRITIRRLLQTTTVCLLMASLTHGESSAESQRGGPPQPGRIDRYPFHGAVPDPTVPPPDIYEYQVYVPARHSKAKRWPLLVVLRPCGSNADEMREVTGLTDLADRENFLAMYPDNSGVCWRGVVNVPTAVERGGGGDADIIAEMTLEAIKNYNADPERVYMIGASGGAFQTAATANAYPDIYAAVGIVAGGGTGMSIECVAVPDEMVAAVYTPTTLARMGERARIIPFFSVGGTEDFLGEQPITGCTRKAFINAMAANNVVSGGVLEGGTVIGGRYALDPSSTENGQVPDGFAWTKEVWRDTQGCQVGERWVVHGMGHTWPGVAVGDPGPNINDPAWEFFSRYRKSDTGGKCAESHQGKGKGHHHHGHHDRDGRRPGKPLHWKHPSVDRNGRIVMEDN